MTIKKPTAKQKRDWNLINDTMTTTLAVGVKVLQDEYKMSELDSGLWAIKTSILLNESYELPTDALQALLEKYGQEVTT